MTTIDIDGDGCGDPGFPASICITDNCPSDFNPGQEDANSDGTGDCDDANTAVPPEAVEACDAIDSTGLYLYAEHPDEEGSYVCVSL